MSGGLWLVVFAVVAAAALLAWVMSRRGRGTEAPVEKEAPASVPAVIDVPAEAAPVVPAPVEAPVVAPTVSVAPPAPPAPARPPPPEPPPPQPPAPPPPPPPPRDVLPVVVSPPVVAPPAAPRPPPVVIERVLALEPADADEWRTAQALSLLPAQAAAVSAAIVVRSDASPLHRVVLQAGTATAIARGDQAAMRSMASANGASARHGATTWLDSTAATALVATALAALASDRFLAGLGDEVRDLKAAVAALPPRVAMQGGPVLKSLMQDLSRFTREARENYVSAIAKLAFRERVGEAEARALELWRAVVVQADATRQQMQTLASLTRFGEVQVEKGLALYKELQDQRQLQEIAGRVLAAARLLRTSIGDAPVAGGADPIDSALAALQAGQAQDAELAARLTASERGAKGDPYVGKAEFEANRAAMRKAMERIADAPGSPAAASLQAARVALPLDAAGGRPRTLLVGPGADADAGGVGLRWLER